MISYANSVKNRPIFAERAQNDAAGNEIGRTYATKAELPTVDQTYDATSTNAQSGVAVAQAIAAIPQTGGGSDEWWGGDPGRIVLSSNTLRLKYKDTTYDPRNDPDSTFLARFSSITKVSDGVFDFVFDSTNINDAYYAAFLNKYQTGSEFIILAWQTHAAGEVIQSTFQGCTGLEAVYNFNNQKSSHSYYSSLLSVFKGCSNLKYFAVYKDPGYYNLHWMHESTNSIKEMFSGCTKLLSCDMTIRLRYSISCDARNAFSSCSSLVQGPELVYGITNATHMFDGCTSLTCFLQSNFAPALTSVQPYNLNSESMFLGCSSLRDATIPLFNTASIYGCNNMFQGCCNLTTVPKLHMTQDQTMEYMFDKCAQLQKLPDLDYSRVQKGSYMFSGCRALTDISSLSTVTWNAALTNVQNMFYDCTAIENGLQAVYTSMAATATITYHSGTFTRCGYSYSNPDLAQIPSAWGGTGS